MPDPPPPFFVLFSISLAPAIWECFHNANTLSCRCPLHNAPYVFIHRYFEHLSLENTASVQSIKPLQSQNSSPQTCEREFQVLVAKDRSERANKKLLILNVWGKQIPAGENLVTGVEAPHARVLKWSGIIP